VLAGDDYADPIRTDGELARAFGITRARFSVIDRRYAVSGAQDTAVCTEVLRRAWLESAPPTAAAPRGAADAGADRTCEVR
jgi:predicted DsbA family dithiol-disulfide isomerase